MLGDIYRTRAGLGGTYSTKAGLGGIYSTRAVLSRILRIRIVLGMLEMQVGSPSARPTKFSISVFHGRNL